MFGVFSQILKLSRDRVTVLVEGFNQCIEHVVSDRGVLNASPMRLLKKIMRRRVSFWSQSLATVIDDRSAVVVDGITYRPST